MQNTLPITPYTALRPWPWHTPEGTGVYTYIDRNTKEKKTIDRTETSGWVAFLIADAERDGGFRQEWIPSNQAHQKIKEYQGAADVRMSWNTFFDAWSAAKNVLYYYCAFADLDYRKAKEYKDAAPEDVSDALIKFCSQNGLPEPSMIINSGNGLHVAWRFAIPSMARAQPQHRKMIKEEWEEFWKKFNEYRRIQRSLSKILKPFGADPLAIDPGKYMRLPGSINTKAEAAGRDGLVRIIHEGPRVYWPDLRDALGVPCMSGPRAGQAPTVNLNNQKKKQSSKNPAPAPFQVIRGEQERPDVIDTKERTWGTWVNINGECQWVLWQTYNALRYWDIYTLMELRRAKHGGTIPEGERSNFLMWLLNFWALWNLEEYEDEEFNRAFRYTFRVLADQIDPAYRKGDKYALMRLKTVQKKWGQGWVNWHGNATTALYTPRTTTLIEKFGVTVEELSYLYTFQPVDTKEQARERKKAQRRREGVRSREDYLKSTVKAMAAAEGVSESTWRRRNPDYVGEKTLKQHPELRAKAK